LDERPVDADVAAHPDGGRLPQEPWQKRDVDGLRRVRAQGGVADGIIYLGGPIVIVMAIVPFLGLRWSVSSQARRFVDTPRRK